MLSLHIAASLDNTGTGNLLGLVTNFAGLSFADMFDETSGLRDDVREIMFRWAGVDSAPPTGRGPNVDGQELAFLEKLMGRDFYQTLADENPGPYAGLLLNEAFTIAYNNIYARLAAQAAGADLFTGDFFYNIATDRFEGITGLDTGAIDDLETEAAGLSTTAEREAFWANAVRVPRDFAPQAQGRNTYNVLPFRRALRAANDNSAARAANVRRVAA